jgi:hypothetical protein
MLRDGEPLAAQPETFPAGTASLPCNEGYPYFKVPTVFVWVLYYCSQSPCVEVGYSLHGALRYDS